LAKVFHMAWGGSLNKDGTKYYRIIRAADKTIEFMEDLKQYLSDKDKKIIDKAIEVITNHINKLSEGEIKDS